MSIFSINSSINTNHQNYNAYYNRFDNIGSTGVIPLNKVNIRYNKTLFDDNAKNIYNSTFTIDNSRRSISTDLTATSIREFKYNILQNLFEPGYPQNSQYNLCDQNISTTFAINGNTHFSSNLKSGTSYPNNHYITIIEDQNNYNFFNCKPLLNTYVSDQIRALTANKDSKSRYFDGIQQNGLYGLDLFLDFYQNNVNSGLDDDSERTKNFVRNPNCWAYDIDLTCCSPWNMHPTLRLPGGYLTTTSNHTAGTLISPRHVIFCKHADFYPPIGSDIRFITKDNQTITRNITNIIKVQPISGNGATDYAIGLLDSDVPDSISFAKVLPDNAFERMQLEWLTPGLPVGNIINKIHIIQLNQDKSVRINGLGLWFNVWFYLTNSGGIDNSLQEFIFNIRLYDSGSPNFLVINNEPILIGLDLGPNRIHQHRLDINTVMNQLGGGYELTSYNLDNFAECVAPSLSSSLPPTPYPTPSAAPPPPPNYPAILYGCEIVNNNGIPDTFTFRYVGSYVWLDSGRYAYLYYDSNDSLWKININYLDSYYSDDIFGIWKILSDQAIPGYNIDDPISGYISSNSDCSQSLSTPTPTPTVTSTPTLTPTPTLTITPTQTPTPSSTPVTLISFTRSNAYAVSSDNNWGLLRGVITNNIPNWGQS
jgi:hypothetical protein